MLPNLVGAADALKVIIENPLSQNRMLKAKEVAALGIADVAARAGRLPRGLAALGRRRPRRRRHRASAARSTTTRPRGMPRATPPARPCSPRPAAARPAPCAPSSWCAAARTATRDDAFAAEDDALGDLIMTDELRAGLYAFDLVQKRAKRPAGAPDKSLARPVTKVGIVGAGLMASQLALLFARRLERPRRADRPRRGAGGQGRGLGARRDRRLLAKRRLSPDKASSSPAWSPGRRARTASPTPTSSSRRSSRRWPSSSRCSPRSRPSSRPSACSRPTPRRCRSPRWRADLQHPERVVGFHFFNPVAVMPLLEIIPGETTDDAALATAFATGRTLGKTTILVKDSASFVVNRLLGRFMGEFSRIVDEGTPVPTSPTGAVRRPGPDAAVRAARAGRPGHRAAQQRDAAPRLR